MPRCAYSASRPKPTGLVVTRPTPIAAPLRVRESPGNKPLLETPPYDSPPFTTNPPPLLLELLCAEIGVATATASATARIIAISDVLILRIESFGMCTIHVGDHKS